MITIPADIKGLIFDLDGTLVDTMPRHVIAWKAAGEKFGVNITDEMIYRWAGMPSLKVVSQINEAYKLNLDPTEISQSKRIAFDELGATMPHKAVEPVVEFARKMRGVLPMAVGTGSNRKTALGILEELELLDWFEIVVTADDVSAHKPDPETFLKGAAGIQREPKDCIVFEDADLGIEAAVRGGMKYFDVRTLS